jgi:hypothetical protein
MIKHFIILSCLTLFASIQAAGFEHFITRSGDRLMEGNREFRFISFNVPNLHYIEDNLAYDAVHPWRLPDEFEIRDALESVRQAGGRAVRIYTLSVRKKDDLEGIPRHVLGPGLFNEEAFLALDRVLAVANETGIRLIIPFVDNWSWWGGIAEYASFRNKPKEAFWNDPEVIADFKRTVSYVINRKNTITGIPYREDRAVLAWETGNELQCPAAWTREIAGFIKSLDPNHLVMDGFFTSILRDESISEPLVDIVTSHHYPADPEDLLSETRRNRDRTAGIKPYVVGEFGFVPTDAVRRFLDQTIADGVSGALIWSLRFHNRDGGFYWHSEPFGGDLYKAYLWPGFPSGEKYDETNLLGLMAEKAYALSGAVPEPAVPAAPVLLPFGDVSRISWKGSAGAQAYDVERSESAGGPWILAGAGISDADLQYRPLFNDEKAQAGRDYFYRVLARNRAGQSGPSNVVGPVRAGSHILVDEMNGVSKCYAYNKRLEIDTRESRKFREDMHRLKSGKGAWILYHVPGAIKSWTVYTFYPEPGPDFLYYSSETDQSLEPVTAKAARLDGGKGDYGYWIPVRFHGESSGGHSYLKIEWPCPAEIGRIEIEYGD